LISILSKYLLNGHFLPYLINFLIMGDAMNDDRNEDFSPIVRIICGAAAGLLLIPLLNAAYIILAAIVGQGY